MYVNPDPRSWSSGPDAESVRRFHARLPRYAPTPLAPAPFLARRIGVRDVWIKDESNRLGLPSFKVLGASWATYRAMELRADSPLEPWTTVAELAGRVEGLRPLRLQAATDGNHGRALAEVARWLGFSARIYVPAGMAPARVRALREAGAEVVSTTGSYDDAVKRAATETDPRTLVVSDTSWPGYEQVPSWVIEGYATIFDEVDEQLGGRPDVIAVQMGVGAFAAAAVRHYRSDGAPQTHLLGVEPDDAACVLASLLAGEPLLVPGPHRSVMAGLNCGLPSLIAWPFLAGGLRCVVTIPDDAAREAVRLLRTNGIQAGESGAAGAAGLLRAAADADLREALGLRADTSVLVVNTEGITDPDA